MVATRTHLPYLDTGAMYRCVALETLRTGTDPTDATCVGHIARSVEIRLEGERTFMNGDDVSAEIRTPEVAGVVSTIATHSEVRDAMREQQQNWVNARGGGVVEGRDIGTVVFPDADVKVFLTASPEERARRRVEQHGGDVEEVARSISERDRIDSTRADSPLRPAQESVVVDSTGKSIELVVDEIVTIYRLRRT